MNSADSASNIWQKVLNKLHEDLTVVAIETWFTDCKAVKFTDNRLILHTSVEFNKKIIEERFMGNIKAALSDILSSREVEVVILDDAGLEAMTQEVETDSLLSINEYTFEHFVVGGSNRIAHAAAVAVADVKQRKKGYNPLLIYGDSGLGKTHLLYAIRHFVEKNHPHYKVIYVKGEEFTNDFVEAIKRGKNLEFRERYRGTDFFLMDDIQFIAGKDKVQEEYFNTFNTLFEFGKQIVLTADRPPKDMFTFDDRLRNRFEQGLLVDIKPPDDALRIAIVKSKAEQLGISLPEDVINFIAENLNQNVRQLEGAVKMLLAYRDLVGEEITVDNIKERLKDAFIKGNDFIPSADDIINETAKYYMLDPEELKGKNRSADPKNARHVAMYLIRKMTNMSVMETGKKFDNRNHSTVISAVNRIASKLANDTTLANEIRDITSNIQNRSIG